MQPNITELLYMRCPTNRNTLCLYYFITHYLHMDKQTKDISYDYNYIVILNTFA